MVTIIVIEDGGVAVELPSIVLMLLSHVFFILWQLFNHIDLETQKMTFIQVSYYIKVALQGGTKTIFGQNNFLNVKGTTDQQYTMCTTHMWKKTIF